MTNKELIDTRITEVMLEWDSYAHSDDVRDNETAHYYEGVMDGMIEARNILLNLTAKEIDNV